MRRFTIGWPISTVFWYLQLLLGTGQDCQRRSRKRRYSLTKMLGQWQLRRFPCSCTGYFWWVGRKKNVVNYWINEPKLLKTKILWVFKHDLVPTITLKLKLNWSWNHFQNGNKLSYFRERLNLPWSLHKMYKFYRVNLLERCFLKITYLNFIILMVDFCSWNDIGASPVSNSRVEVSTLKIAKKCKICSECGKKR